jgi:hypothetical protein
LLPNRQFSPSATYYFECAFHRHAFPLANPLSSSLKVWKDLPDRSAQ